MNRSLGRQFLANEGEGPKRKPWLSLRIDGSGKETPGFAHAFVADDAAADTIENLLRRLSVPEDEITPLISQIRTDGWRSYQVAARELEIAHHRAILKDPKDSMKLLPWTHRLIANATAVISGPAPWGIGKASATIPDRSVLPI
jgi:hypothetical protein